MKTILSSLLLLLGLTCISAVPIPSRTYENDRNLTVTNGPYFHIYWTLDGNTLQLGMVCETVGWCAIGFSRFGAMVDSDAVIASFDGVNGLQIVDYFLKAQVAASNGTCPNAVCPDTATPGCGDNVFNRMGGRNGSYLIFEFDRLVVAGDACDRAIPVSPTNREHLIWSVGPGDAMNVAKHTFRDFTSGINYWNWAPNTRIYYLAVEEATWDYAPLRTSSPSSDTWLASGPDRIGRSYKKAIYTEYTDNTFQFRRFPSLAMNHTAMLGPVIRAQVGDIIVIIFKNLLPVGGRNYSVHPHGVFYDLTNEGSSLASFAPPGQTKVYSWFVPERAGPGPNDGSSVMWLYGSRVDPVKDPNTGLLGPIIITQRGMTTSSTDFKPSDVDREFITVFKIYDENQSHFLADNMATLTNPPAVNDAGFMESNRKYTINGYTFNNNDEFIMNTDERVRWYVASVGDVNGVHVPNWEGQSFLHQGSRSDNLAVLPAQMMEIDMIPDAPGASWEMHCGVAEHQAAGMTNNFVVNGVNFTAPVVTGQTRTYFIAADEVTWNYTPTNAAPAQGAPYTTRNATRIGTTYTKVIYREYTDNTFTSLKPVPAQWAHKGIIGPIIRAEVGDGIEVQFKNNVVNLTNSYSIRPHGVFWDLSQAGPVAPGDVVTYNWVVPTRAGPGPNDPSSILWLYTSDVAPQQDLHSGLVGAIIVTRAGSTKSGADLSPSDVDKEFITLYSIVDENRSPYIDYNIATYAGSPGSVDKSEPGFVESNKKHAINGLLYNNVEGLTMAVNDRVRWYVAAVGDVHDLHAPHWDGQTVTEHGLRRDTLTVLPSQFLEVDMTVDNVGSWNMYCHVNSHNFKGMNNKYRVTGTPIVPNMGRERVYYIAAEDVDWDYAPTNRPTQAGPWITAGPDRVGSVYSKIRYVEYTDATFTYRKGMSSRWIHKGILGPIIRAEVGELITINFMNRVASVNVPLNIRAHGVFDTLNTTTGVLPGSSAVYTWRVPSRAGPATSDTSSVMWLYHSTVDVAADVNSGLVGAILITRQGASRSAANGDLMPNDVDREFVVLMTVMDENLSHRLAENVARTTSANVNDPGFIAANKKSTINGYIFDNLPSVIMKQNERVRWYLAAIGDQADLHSLHWHGLSTTIMGQRTDVASVIPAKIVEADMIPDNLGLWLAHSHVDTYTISGMSMKVNVSLNVTDYYIADEAPPSTSTDVLSHSDSKDDGFPLLYILIIAIGGGLLLLLAALLVAFFVTRRRRRENMESDVAQLQMQTQQSSSKKKKQPKHQGFY